MTLRLALPGLLVLLLAACGSTGSGGGASLYKTLRDGQSAGSAPGASVDWSLSVSGTDVKLEVAGRTLDMGGVAANKRVRYAVNPGALMMTLQIMGQPPLVIRGDSIRVGTRSYPLPHPGRYDVDLSADPPWGRF